MDPERQAISELDRANRAKNLLEDELLRSAFDDLRTKYREEWENTTSDQAELREDLYMSLRLLNEVEGSLKTHVTTGTMAEITLEKIRADRTAS